MAKGFLIGLLLSTQLLGIQVIAEEFQLRSLASNPKKVFTVKQGGLILGTTNPENTIKVSDSSVKNRLVQLSKSGQFIIGIGRDEKTIRISVLSPQNQQTDRVINVQQRQYKIERVDGLPPSKVTPVGEAVKNRIARDSRLVRRARKIDSFREDYLGGFQWPVKGRISGVYGSQRILNGKPRRPHFGVDIARSKGTVVFSPASGKVLLAEKDLYFSGGTVMIDHGHGLSSSFLHLSEIDVELGQVVKQGEPIAKIGSTGRATGPHLDWRMNWFNVRIDPQLLVTKMQK